MLKIYLEQLQNYLSNNLDTTPQEVLDSISTFCKQNKYAVDGKWALRYDTANSIDLVQNPIKNSTEEAQDQYYSDKIRILENEIILLKRQIFKKVG